MHIYKKLLSTSLFLLTLSLMAEEVQKSSVTTINAADFDLVLNTDKPVLLKMFSPKCGPCKTFKPLFEEFALAHDCYACFEIEYIAARELAQTLKLQGLPSVFVFLNGKHIGTILGMLDPQNLKLRVEEFIQKFKAESGTVAP